MRTIEFAKEGESGPEPPSPTVTFSTDWFSSNIPTWRHFLGGMAGAARLRALEIGCWEGRATCWLLQHILTHDDSCITVIDTFKGSSEHMGSAEYTDSLLGLEVRFRGNVHALGFTHKVIVKPATSEAALVELLAISPRPEFDLIYVDGSHTAADVLSDAVLAFKLLRKGGTLIFDDYLWSSPGSQHPQQSPKAGIDAFLGAHVGLVQVIHFGYQVIVQRT